MVAHESAPLKEDGFDIPASDLEGQGYDMWSKRNRIVTQQHKSPEFPQGFLCC
jgi:hypothetical protein